MLRLLILDDDQIRHDQFNKKFVDLQVTTVYTAEEAIIELKKNEFDYVFLDHDLGGLQMVSSGDGTGYEVAEWLSLNTDRLPRSKIILHSLNPVGRKNMLNVLQGVGVFVEEVPFAWSL